MCWVKEKVLVGCVLGGQCWSCWEEDCAAGPYWCPEQQLGLVRQAGCFVEGDVSSGRPRGSSFSLFPWPFWGVGLRDRNRFLPFRCQYSKVGRWVLHTDHRHAGFWLESEQGLVMLKLAWKVPVI